VVGDVNEELALVDGEVRDVVADVP